MSSNSVKKVIAHVTCICHSTHSVIFCNLPKEPKHLGPVFVWIYSGIDMVQEVSNSTNLLSEDFPVILWGSLTGTKVA